MTPATTTTQRMMPDRPIEREYGESGCAISASCSSRALGASAARSFIAARRRLLGPAVLAKGSVVHALFQWLSVRPSPGVSVESGSALSADPAALFQPSQVCWSAAGTVNIRAGPGSLRAGAGVRVDHHRGPAAFPRVRWTW